MFLVLSSRYILLDSDSEILQFLRGFSWVGRLTNTSPPDSNCRVWWLITGYDGRALVQICRLLVGVSTLRWAMMLVRDTCTREAVMRVPGLAEWLLPSTRVPWAGTAG